MFSPEELKKVTRKSSAAHKNNASLQKPEHDIYWYIPMLITRLAQAFDTQKLPYAIVGGFAVALHGAVRGTIDLDIVIHLKEADFIRAEIALKSIGLITKLPVGGAQVFQFREEYIQNRSLIAWSFYNTKTPSEVVDIVITEDLSQVKVVKLKYLQQTLRVASIADLIRMKKISNRPQDQQDIVALQHVLKNKGSRDG